MEVIKIKGKGKYVLVKDVEILLREVNPVILHMFQYQVDKANETIIEKEK